MIVNLKIMSLVFGGLACTLFIASAIVYCKEKKSKTDVPTPKEQDMQDATQLLHTEWEDAICMTTKQKN